MSEQEARPRKFKYCLPTEKERRRRTPGPSSVECTYDRAASSRRGLEGLSKMLRHGLAPSTPPRLPPEHSMRWPSGLHCSDVYRASPRLGIFLDLPQLSLAPDFLHVLSGRRHRHRQESILTGQSTIPHSTVLHSTAMLLALFPHFSTLHCASLHRRASSSFPDDRAHHRKQWRTSGERERQAAISREPETHLAPT
jgi:hypothetical protein